MKTINNRIKSVVREEILIETTLNRIEEYVKNNEIAIITAWRNQFVNITNATDKPTHIKRVYLCIYPNRDNLEIYDRTLKNYQYKIINK